MSWTEERVERLSRLWLEGRSASQIAGELGEGVTRNAVIGKVHRLGLSGRDPAPVDAPQLRAKATSPVEPIALAPVLEDAVSEIDVVRVPLLRLPRAQFSALLRRTCPGGVPARRRSSPRRTHGPHRLRASGAVCLPRSGDERRHTSLPGGRI